ncbi:hypothetical protein J0692_26060, partial [Vibrio alginolyticus]|nr:hypothetical protein [Vibrio alginolyticus]
MKKLIAFICVSLITFSASAQTSQRAKNYLQEVTKKFNSYKNVVIDFSFTSRNDKNASKNYDSN